MKRVFDITVSFVCLLLFAPLMLLLIILIKKDSRGPILYKGIRVGRNGRKFRILKFRTMALDAEKMGGPSIADDDPRVTKIGKILRRYKLDELPQLINVFKGEMSLVGPRPEVQRYVDMFTEEEKTIFDVRPGITDWASIWNSNEGAILAGSADPEKIYMEKIRPEKIRLQLKYVHENSFLIDLKIIINTFLAILKR